MLLCFTFKVISATCVPLSALADSAAALVSNSTKPNRLGLNSLPANLTYVTFPAMEKKSASMSSVMEELTLPAYTVRATSLSSMKLPPLSRCSFSNSMRCSAAAMAPLIRCGIGTNSAHRLYPAGNHFGSLSAAWRHSLSGSSTSPVITACSMDARGLRRSAPDGTAALPPLERSSNPPGLIAVLAATTVMGRSTSVMLWSTKEDCAASASA